MGGTFSSLEITTDALWGEKMNKHFVPWVHLFHFFFWLEYLKKKAEHKLATQHPKNTYKLDENKSTQSTV